MKQEFRKSSRSSISQTEVKQEFSKTSISSVSHAEVKQEFSKTSISSVSHAEVKQEFSIFKSGRSPVIQAEYSILYSVEVRCLKLIQKS